MGGGPAGQRCYLEEKALAMVEDSFASLRLGTTSRLLSSQCNARLELCQERQCQNIKGFEDQNQNLDSDLVLH